MAAKLGESNTERVAEILRASKLLKYLSDCGNKAACFRLADIRQMCLRLAIDISVQPTRQSSVQPDWSTAGGNAEMGRNAEGSLSRAPWDGIEGLLSGELDMFAEEGSWDFALDGTVETDWGELEKLASNFE